MAKTSDQNAFKNLEYPDFTTINVGEFVYHYVGRVLPERLPFNIPEYHAAMGGISGDEDVNGVVSIKVSASQFSVTCRFQKEITDFLSLRNSVEDMVLTQVDAVSLLVSQPLSIQLDCLINNVDHTLTFFDTEPSRWIDVEKRINLQDIRNANNYYAGVFLRDALRDYSEAMKSARSSAFLCYRVIETLRQFFEQLLAIEDRRFAWQIFRRHIPIWEEHTRRLDELAAGERHGEPSAIGGDARGFCLQIACAAIVYFVEMISASHSEGLNPNRPL